MPNPEESEKAAFGTLKHEALATRNLELLGGDTAAENEVARVLEFMNETRGEFPLVYNELTLKTEKIFGTLDHLGLNEKQTKAIIVDAKFGAWTVTTARRNLQGIAYVIIAFNNFPTLKKIKIVFYAAKTGLHSEAVFWRYQLPRLEKRVYRIIGRATLAKASPTLGDYTPNAVNCSFCIRLNCPARLALMGTLVTQWTGRPVELPHLDLLKVTTPQLGALKRLSNVFKTFSSAVDNEAKRRAFDESDLIPGYEIAEKSGTRTVVGAPQITAASKLIAEDWNKFFANGYDWGEYLLRNVELSLSDLEKEIGKQAPKGKATLAKKIIVEALENAGLINAGKVFYLQAIKE